MIRQKDMLKKGYIYIVRNQDMVPSHRYPEMESISFDDHTYLARIPISRDLDWNYPTRIHVQEMHISELHIIN